MLRLNILSVVHDAARDMVTLRFKTEGGALPFVEDRICFSAEGDEVVRQRAAIHATLSVVLPFALKLGKVSVNLGPAALSADEVRYWLSQWPGQIEIAGDTAEPLSWVHGVGRPAILFGGGIESCFGLWKLQELSPVLISIKGEKWMNNQPDPIKTALELRAVEIASAHSTVDLAAVHTNARRIYPGRDEVFNHLCTGRLFYFLAWPAMHRLGSRLLFKCSEMEEALRFTAADDSINPRVTNSLSMSGAPVFSSFLNAFPKSLLFKELLTSPYAECFYSCLNNSGRRWCGKCRKCRRVSEYCKRSGFDHARIDLTPLHYDNEEGRHYHRFMELLRPT